MCHVCLHITNTERGKSITHACSDERTFLFLRSRGGALYMLPENIISVDVGLTRTRSVAIFSLEVIGACKRYTV